MIALDQTREVKFIFHVSNLHSYNCFFPNRTKIVKISGFARADIFYNTIAQKKITKNSNGRELWRK